MERMGMNKKEQESEKEKESETALLASLATFVWRFFMG
jgi:hypothetical protein